MSRGSLFLNRIYISGNLLDADAGVTSWFFGQNVLSLDTGQKLGAHPSWNVRLADSNDSLNGTPSESGMGFWNNRGILVDWVAEAECNDVLKGVNKSGS